MRKLSLSPSGSGSGIDFKLIPKLSPIIDKIEESKEEEFPDLKSSMIKKKSKSRMKDLANTTSKSGNSTKRTLNPI